MTTVLTEEWVVSADLTVVRLLVEFQIISFGASQDDFSILVKSDCVEIRGVTKCGSILPLNGLKHFHCFEVINL